MTHDDQYMAEGRQVPAQSAKLCVMAPIYIWPVQDYHSMTSLLRR